MYIDVLIVQSQCTCVHVHVHVVGIYKCMSLFRSICVETLHTILIGTCKYMLKSFMNHASTPVKKDILAIISSFPHF